MMVSTENLYNIYTYIVNNVHCDGTECDNCSAYNDDMAVCVYLLLDREHVKSSRTIKSEDALRYMYNNIYRHYCSHNCSRCELNSPRYGCVSRLLTRHFNSLLGCTLVGCDIHA